MMRCFYRLLSLALLLFVTACASPSGKLGSNPDGAVPHYKVGDPYQIGGIWYYPKEDYSYDETGIASWYGKDFHGDATANGEIYNKDELTAAHKTLPLPSLARVTNLDNGKSIVVRINDRGPFSGARLIDVSQRSAELLGFDKKGTAKVRVQVLADESKAIADAMRHYGSDSPVQLASAQAAPVTSVTSQTLEPVMTTPAIHRQLLETKPVARAVQVKVTGANQLFVQAGSFTVLENATKLKQTLSKLGSVSISDSVVNGTKFYRVRLGPAVDVAHADALLAKVKLAGVQTPRILVD